MTSAKATVLEVIPVTIVVRELLKLHVHGRGEVSNWVQIIPRECAYAAANVGDEIEIDHHVLPMLADELDLFGENATEGETT